MTNRQGNYRLGALYAVTTAVLLSCQEPLSFSAARELDGEQFILITQASLLVSVPLLILHPRSARDFVKILRDPKMWGKLGVIFALGMAGLLLYRLGLKGAHPIIIAAIFNLSPFWAAGVARVVSKLPIPVAPPIFFSCLAGAFSGAMAVAYSQLSGGEGDLASALFKGSWVFALPIPILSALNGTLIGKWFSNYDEGAAVAANFLVPSATLIPITAVLLFSRYGGLGFGGHLEAVALMALGTLVAASLGRVLYQVALTATGNDNGFVTMFFLLVPGLTGLVSWPLAHFVPALAFRLDPAYFAGLAAIAAALLAFSLASWRAERARG